MFKHVVLSLVLLAIMVGAASAFSVSYTSSYYGGYDYSSYSSWSSPSFTWSWGPTYYRSIDSYSPVLTRTYTSWPAARTYYWYDWNPAPVVSFNYTSKDWLDPNFDTFYPTGYSYFFYW